MRRRVVFLLLLLIVAEARAVDRNEVRAINVALQPIFTMLGAALQGKLRTRDDVLRCVGTGAVAGYAFYEAKVNAANGDVRAAWLIANAASSISANAAAGRHPLSRLRWTVGPLRAEVTTPFEKDPNARLHVGISAYELGALVHSTRAFAGGLPGPLVRGRGVPDGPGPSAAPVAIHCARCAGSFSLLC